MPVDIYLDQDGDGKLFDAARKGQMPAGCLPGDVLVITKSKGTRSGQAVALIAHRMVVDGRSGWAQFVLTAREIEGIAQSVRGAHPLANVEDSSPAGTSIHGMHRGVAYDAVKVEKVYIVKVEGVQTINLAFSEEEAHQIGKAAVNLRLDKPTC